MRIVADGICTLVVAALKFGGIRNELPRDGVLDGVPIEDIVERRGDCNGVAGYYSLDRGNVVRARVPDVRECLRFSVSSTHCDQFQFVVAGCGATASTAPARFGQPR